MFKREICRQTVTRGRLRRRQWVKEGKAASKEEKEEGAAPPPTSTELAMTP